jgi:cytochrome c peroxidase
MAVFSLEEGSMEDREQLLEAPEPEQAAEELDADVRKFESEEQLRQHLLAHYKSKGVDDRARAMILTEKALSHFKDALENRENRVLYDRLEDQ